jgi:hypothetical protein
MERFVHLSHCRKLEVRLKTAWVGQEPTTSTGEEFGLAVDYGSGSKKGRPVRLQPKDDDAPGTQLPTSASSAPPLRRRSSTVSSLAADVTRPTRFVTPMPSPSSVCCSAGERTDSVNHRHRATPRPGSPAGQNPG